MCQIGADDNLFYNVKHAVGFEVSAQDVYGIETA